MFRSGARGFPQLPDTGPGPSRRRGGARGDLAPDAASFPPQLAAPRIRFRSSSALMAHSPAHDFFAASSAAVANLELRRKLENATGRHLHQVAETRAEFPPFDAERDTARKIKEEAIGRLDELLIELKNRLEANGCKVFVAGDAAEARAYILDVAKRCGARKVVKGK